MRRLLAILLVVLLGVGGATALVLAARDESGGGSGGTVESGDTSDGTGEGPLRPPPGVTLVAGRVDNLALLPAQLAPVETPLRVDALEQGRASARISPVLVEGDTSSIVWSGGTALTLDAVSDGGGLELGPATVEVGAPGLIVSLDGVTGTLTPGSYRLEGPVALGREGLAGSAETVTFEATSETAVSFEGSATLELPPDPRAVEGPGEVVLVGDVELTTEERDRRVGAFEFGPGPYRLDLVWIGEHLEVDGVLEGEIRTAAP